MLYLLSVAAILASALSLVIDRPDSIVKGWTELKRTDPLKPIKLVFAVKNQNVDELHSTLLAVSTPGDAEYGNHRSVQELREMIAPSATAIDAVQDFLITNFDPELVVRETDNEDLWSVQTDIKSAEKILGCEYFDYLSDIDGVTVVSRVKLGTHYELDAAIGQHLYFVSPTHRFPYLQNRLKKSVGRGSVTPKTLRALYNLGTVAGKSSNNTQGVASFRTNTYDIADCEAMWKAYDIESCTVTNVPSTAKTGHALEAELDTQYMSSMGQAIPMQVWLTKGINFEDDLISWTQSVLSASNPPDLFSVSYGGTETDFGESYCDKLNTDLATMGAAGITVMFAAGDSGAGGGCTENSAFEPDYPASSPYVTAVGGVQGGTAGKTPVGESVWIDGGGGFSNYAATQSWQTDAVSTFLSTSTSLPDSDVFNSSGRGFPDISAQSVDFLIYVDGSTDAVDGTSCASPTAGGIFALLNDLRAQNGMSKLGFLNPFIYSTAAADSTAFNDVTEGYNKGCTPGVARGFSAIEKWDAASGYGSPNYAVLKEKVLETGQQTLKHQARKPLFGQRDHHLLKNLAQRLKEAKEGKQ